MTDKVVPIRAVAEDDGNTGNSGNTPQGEAQEPASNAFDPSPYLSLAKARRQTESAALLSAAPGNETDHFMTDVASEVLASVLDTAQAEQGLTPQATETAVCILLLAAAELRWTVNTTAGRGASLSAKLLYALDELEAGLVAEANAYDAPVAEHQPERRRLRPCSKDQGDPLRVPGPHSVELVKGWLAALKPQPTGEDDDTPPAAA